MINRYFQIDFGLNFQTGPQMQCLLDFDKILLVDLHYGNTGRRVFKRRVQNWKDFCLKINIPKGNY